MFDALLELKRKSGSHFLRKLETHPNIIAWINTELPLLSDPVYNLKTKAYWMFTGIVDFPECEICNNPVGKGQNVGFSHGYSRTCSEECARALRAKSSKEHCLEAYGVENVFQLPRVIEKIHATKFEKHGDPYFTNRPAAIRTFRAKYGVDNPMQCQECVDKFNDTMQDRYGVNRPLQSPQIMAQMNQTVQDRYGVSHVSHLQSVQDKIVKTNKKRYGVDRPFQNSEVRKKAQIRYQYNSLKFDSSPEMAYYIWLTDHNIQFEYQPDVSFEYSYQNKTKAYCPDFRVEGKLQEIKGDMFFEDKDPTKRMICPWNHDEDDLYEAKHQCMLVNGVEIITSKDYEQYMEYCRLKFQDRDWHVKFKTNNSKGNERDVH